MNKAIKSMTMNAGFSQKIVYIKKNLMARDKRRLLMAQIKKAKIQISLNRTKSNEVINRL